MACIGTIISHKVHGYIKQRGSYALRSYIGPKRPIGTVGMYRIVICQILDTE